ncbi:MAG: lipoyl synthase [Verrucomicrobia bacterium]|nr:lipoyl synthase [Verrucomicrobiota bacterium]MBS0636238.1 lipoyl synthase [Verrucomicrobiota bacterium]
MNLLPENPQKGCDDAVVGPGRFPSWLHRKMPEGNLLQVTNGIIQKKELYTVCEEAKCPNLLECYSKKTATFLILGKACTRACSFCDIDFSKAPKAPDANEPKRVAESVKELGLSHVVITMVARDDLADGGAGHLVEVIKEVRRECPNSTIETLTSDFEGNTEALDTVLNEKPEIFNHNVETVRRLSPTVRHKATFDRSLSVLSYAKQKWPEMLVKSGIMIGLGETKEEVLDTLKELKDAGCDIVTIGQYLQASRLKLRVKEFIHPDIFTEYADAGRALGISHVYAGPFVRSSYNAKLFVKRNNRMYEIESQ